MLTNSLFSEYIHPMDKNLSKEAICIKSANDNYQWSKIWAIYLSELANILIFCGILFW